MAEKVELVRRGKSVGATGAAADYEWWQELPADQDADSLRSVGYEVVSWVRTSSLQFLVVELERKANEADEKLADGGEMRHWDEWHGRSAAFGEAAQLARDLTREEGE